MRKTALLLAPMALAVLLACVVALVVVNTPAKAAFPGLNGKIAFVSDPHFSGDSDIWVINPDRSGRNRLTNDPANDSDPAFSPDGSTIAYTSDAGGNKDIYVMASDGSDQPSGLTDDSADDFQPNWSPDGSMITFASERGEPIIDSEIYVMKADGSEPKGLTNPSDGYSDYEPCFSPDGTKIAFTHEHTCGEVPCPPGELCICIDDSGPFEIAVMKADGTDLTTQVFNQLLAGAPDWQPNTAPVVTLLRPAPGSTTTDRTPRISAKVKDVQENLSKSNITLTLDERVIKRTAFTYDRSTDRLSYTPGVALPYGRHTVRMVAEDTSEASTTKEWRFRMVRP